MDNINEIRNRINYNKKNNKSNPFLKLIKILMVLMCIAVSFLIYAKNDENAVFLQKTLNINLSFKDFNQKVGLFFSKLASSLNIFDSNDQMDDTPVSSNISYISLGNSNFMTEDNTVPMLFFGKIVNVQKKNDMNQVTVYYQNDVIACYYNLIDLYVKKNDLLNEKNIIGTYNESFKVLFQYENCLIDYEEAILK